jgi:hypothetical protein
MRADAARLGLMVAERVAAVKAFGVSDEKEAESEGRSFRLYRRPAILVAGCASPADRFGSEPQTQGWGPAEFTSAGAGENPPLTERCAPVLGLRRRQVCRTGLLASRTRTRREREENEKSGGGAEEEWRRLRRAENPRGGWNQGRITWVPGGGVKVNSPPGVLVLISGLRKSKRLRLPCASSKSTRRTW